MEFTLQMCVCVCVYMVNQIILCVGISGCRVNSTARTLHMDITQHAG